MAKHHAILCIGIAWLLAFCSCGRRHDRQEQAAVKMDYTAEAHAMADSIAATMTDEELAGQLFMPAVYSTGEPDNLQLLDFYARRLHVGGIVLLRGDTAGAALIASHMAALKPKAALWIAIDAETGLGMRLKDAEILPPAMTLGKTADGQQMYDYGRRLAADSRRLGINMILGPVLDVESDPGGFIGSRSFGADAAQVAELGTSMARGLEDGGVISVAKHFPGHGNAHTDTHRELGVIEAPLSEIERTALPPFREYIDNGLSAIMVGHLAVPAIDPKLRSAALSGAVITDLLRTDLGFEGLVITDALNMKGARGTGSDTAEEAVRAGADIVIAPADTRREIESLVLAMKKDPALRSKVKESVHRILFYKYRFAQR